MIELRTLGSLDLRTPDGTSAGSVLAQPKRLALLVYLALATPDGFVRRDTLLALFWPESDDERARAALRQAVRYLRRSLGEATIVNRAEDEIGVAVGMLRCDAVELRRALAAGEHERALAGYAGELLPGFNIDDAPEFERWLDAQRATLRSDVAAAAAALADRAAARAELHEALRWARQAAAMLPLDEAALRRVVTLLDRTGERAAAVAAYQDFERRLAAELALEPSVETRAVVERIRAGEVVRTAAVPQPTVVHAPDVASRAEPAIGNGDEAPTMPAVSSVRSPSRGMRLRGAVAALLASGVMLAAGVVYASRNSPAPPSLNASRVLVATFQNHAADDAYDTVGRMAADWIIEGVSRTGRFEVVPSTAVWATERYLVESGAAPFGAARYREMARETGAGVVVVGSYYRQSEWLHFQAQILDATTGRVLRPVDAVSAHGDSLVAGIDQLRGRVLTALATVGDTVYHLRAAAAPPSYEAYAEYLAGMDAFVGGDVAAALRRYERAAAADPEYPMPWLAAAIMHMNLGDFVAADSIAARVAPMHDRLGPLERHTLGFVLALLRGDRPAAYDAMVRAAAIAPGTINEHMIGELARDMNRPREAIRVLSAMDPQRGELRGWRVYWRELTYAQHMLGDHRRELRDARRARALHPHDPLVLSFEVQALAALGRTAELDERIEQRLASSNPGWPSAGALMAIAAHELAAHGHTRQAARLYERSIAWYEALAPEARTAGHRAAHAAALRHAGRAAEALPLLSALIADHPDDLHHLGALGITLARLGDRAGAERIAARLAAYTPPQGRAGPINRPWGSHAYTAAAIAAQLGEPDRAVALLRQAQTQGMRMAPHIHADPDLAPLREHPAFREWLRPKG
jgi:DNA-binding SARP family transcriptional activator/tetratricopeptide (TPR) repeat protein